MERFQSSFVGHWWSEFGSILKHRHQDTGTDEDLANQMIYFQMMLNRLVYFQDHPPAKGGLW